MITDLQHLWHVLLRILQLIVYLNIALDGVTPVLVYLQYFCTFAHTLPPTQYELTFFLYLLKPHVFHRLFYLPMAFLLNRNQRKERIFIWEKSKRTLQCQLCGSSVLGLPHFSMHTLSPPASSYLRKASRWQWKQHVHNPIILQEETE